jgi:cytidine deaminase
VAGPLESVTPPCGACRQVLTEFAPGLRVLYTQKDGFQSAALADLLPAAFELP